MKPSDLARHVALLHQCAKCLRMASPPVSGGPVRSPVMLVGQAPGVKEPVLGRPFAWTAGKTLFRWFESASGITEAEFRERIYMAAVCRCFPGKNPAGGDRVPDPGEIAACSEWMRAEFALLRPQLVLAVGKLAIAQFVGFDKLVEVVGPVHRLERWGHAFDLVALPHPSGASTWHRMEPGRTLLARAMNAAVTHAAFRRLQTKGHSLSPRP